MTKKTLEADVKLRKLRNQSITSQEAKIALFKTFRLQPMANSGKSRNVVNDEDLFKYPTSY